MTIDGVSGRTSYIGSGIVNLRSQLDTLTQQLASGKVSNTYAGQGDGRSLAVGLRAQLNKLDGYADTAVNLNTRIGVANLSLQHLVDIGSTVKAAAVSATSTIDNTGQTPGQKTASLSFVDSVDMLNARSGDRYLFSGRATDTAPVSSSDVIMNGNGAQAGLKQLISERKQADVGTSGLGRLVIAAPSTTAVSIAEDVSPSTFGLKLNAINSSLTGATVTGPIGSPAAISVDLGATNPGNGDQVKFTFNLPDSTTEAVVLTASTATPLPANAFAIGADSTATAANLKAALTTSVGKLANGALVAASAITAGDNFFDQPPMRVSGTPLGSATSLVAGTSTDTVSWYHGEPDSSGDPARGTAVAQVDQGITVRYGARADEQALRAQLQTVAVFAAVSVSATDPNANAQIAALNQRVAQNLAVTPGTQSIQDIQADFAGAQYSIKSTTDRQTQTKTMTQTMLDSIEGVNNDEIATKILALQTALQASYQTTAQLYQMSLVKFI